MAVVRMAVEQKPRLYNGRTNPGRTKTAAVGTTIGQTPVEQKPLESDFVLTRKGHLFYNSEPVSARMAQQAQAGACVFRGYSFERRNNYAEKKRAEENLEPATSFVLEIVTRVNYCCKLPPTPI
jgi:hypothetical protein